MRVARTGAFIEVSAVIAYPMCHHFGHSMTLQTARELMEAVGFAQVVISTDAGQIHNPWPPDIMRAFVNALIGIGLAAEDVLRMVTNNPRKLLGLGAAALRTTPPAVFSTVSSSS